ncbi:MAG: FAD-binding oxidoreductase [Candidatus Aenigmarchaeota archaeon]|nr:FAD-binding oxidoreductase [Candidatus Aenigmarchaeota archaeon]
MIDVNALKEKFVNIVGKSNVTDNSFQLDKNSTDKTQIKASPILIVWPNNKQQVSEIVKVANKERIPIVPRGGGSGLCGGAVANESIVINLTKMNRILKMDKRRKYAITQPGIFLDNLSKVVNKDNLFFPVQLASHKIATVGGMISTNAGGEHVLRFGKMSDNILAIEVVTGDGRLINVRGNKINHFCGTEGLMGIVVEARLKLLPRIKRRSITILEVDTLKDLMAVVKKVVKDKNLLACEFIGPKVYKMAGFREKYFILLEYKDEHGEIVNRRQIRKFWKIRENCFFTLFKHDWKIIADPKLSLKNVGKFLEWCKRRNLPAFGHIGHGIIHVHFKTVKEMEDMYTVVLKLNGEISGEHGFGIIKRRYLPYKKRFELKKLKRIYDRNNILNPEKVI